MRELGHSGFIDVAGGASGDLIDILTYDSEALRNILTIS
jgi:hypothetical protein